MISLGRRRGELLSFLLATGALSLTGFAGGAAAAHLSTSSQANAEAFTRDSADMVQQGLVLPESAPPRPSTQVPKAAITSIAAATSTDPSRTSESVRPESRTRSAGDAVPSAVPAQPAPPRSAHSSPPIWQVAPPAPAPAPQPAPAPAPAPAPGIQIDLPSPKPQQSIRPGQLHFG